MSEKMTHKWKIQIIEGNEVVFEEKVTGDDNARSLFHIKQVEILSRYEVKKQVIQANPLSGEARGLAAKMPNNQIVYMIMED